jgi:hypothetical protein
VYVLGGGKMPALQLRTYMPGFDLTSAANSRSQSGQRFSSMPGWFCRFRFDVYWSTIW